MNNCKFLYVRNEFRNRDVTIVSDIFREDDKNFVRFAWTFRNSKDKFIKKEGAKIALERLENMEPGYSAVVEVEEFKFYSLAGKILSTILESSKTPDKFVYDISTDLNYFNYRSKNEKPSWGSLFDGVQ